MYKNILFFFLIIASGRSYGQIEPLKIGSKMPDIELKRIYNYNKPILWSDNLDGKVILFDFWATYCGACIEGMSELATLQQDFNEDIQVFLVTDETREKIVDFFGRREDLKLLNLPIITQADTLIKLFPHSLIPHIVWIGKDRIIRAITGSTCINEKNIAQLIDFGHINLPVKEDIVNFNYDRPFRDSKEIRKKILENNGFLFGSMLTRGLIGVGSHNGINYTDSTIRVFETNLSILSLYTDAYKFDITILPSDIRTRIIFDFEENNNRDLNTLNGNSIERYLKQRYCYELIVPRDKSNDLKREKYKTYDFMKKELDRYFNVKSAVEKRNMDCYIISCVDTNHLIKRRPNMTSYWKEDRDSLIIKNVPVEMLVVLLNQLGMVSSPFIYEGPRGILINSVIDMGENNIDAISNSLKRFGLNLSKGKRRLKVLVLSNT